MGREGGLWAVVLASGPGRRVIPDDGEGPAYLQVQPDGITLLHNALQRAACLVSEKRLRVVVSAKDRRHWQWQLADLNPSCTIEEPQHRGAAASILLSLTLILREDPEASVVILPADMLVRDELVLHQALAIAAASVREHLSQILLLGMAPSEGEGGCCDWLVPQRQIPHFGLSAVARVLACPGAEETATLRAQGALAKSSILVARGSTLRALFEQHLPALALSFCLWAGDAPGLPELFSSIDRHDLTRDLLQPALERLSVVSVPPCGWTDLEAPQRPAKPASSRQRIPLAPPPRPDQTGTFPVIQRTA